MDFRQALKSGRTIIVDGGMGTQLEKRGLELTGAANNISHPETVRQVHEDYAAAGAEVLISNTFSMNPVYIATHHLPMDTAEANKCGVAIAREAAHGGQWVFGDIGPTGQMLQPFGTYTEEDFFQAFRAQVQALADSGVDGLIIETMYDLNEALAALRACREVSDLPVIVSFALSTKSQFGRTMMGQTLADCARAVAAGGGDVVGVNCGDLDPSELAEIIAHLRPEITLPIIVQPNAGKPKLAAGKTFYDMSPEVFAAGVVKCVQAGAQMVGGCCGTTPEHIQAVTAALAGIDPASADGRK